ncbi:MAG: hypothetical protein ACYTGR_20175, partial [Planctomycetota bacterium]
MCIQSGVSKMLAALVMMLTLTAYASAQSDCCEANGTPGCDNAECEALVCAADAFCCDTQWDGICAGAAADLCGDLCGGGAAIGACCFDDGTCLDGASAEGCIGKGGAYQGDGTTCADVSCGGGGGGGDCCIANGSPGCDDAGCEATVCAADPFCCDTEWDQICADAAADLCGKLCGGPPPTGCPGEGNCCEPNGTPGCDDAECCELICSLDPFCCDTEWDGLCAKAALLECEGCAAGDCGDGCCFDANGGAGCNDEECCQAVCANDPFCCDSEWDGLCAKLALDICTGDCEGDTNGDESVDVQDLTNVILAWGTGDFDADVDHNCVVDVADLTTVILNWGDCGGGACGDEAAGDCCEPNGTPACNDAACCEAVCGADAFCCDIEWDQICADAATEICAKLCSGPPPGDCPGEGGDCCSDNGTPGCDDAGCCEAVCAVDPFCCETAWDGICAEQAARLCAKLCGGPPPKGSDCCIPNGTPGCDDAECEATVCAADTFCCDTDWDQICA